ncbi:DUF6703 family protein [Actinocatenispora rupis]|uniref:Uncharacterized protein n=1 Tax=Actinocatenispora rupis TaxID=519421 RepID=A0A8J3J2S3_9ACTN|nr:DUF6703 family protein [Actinocatenispora rupis]GID13530.1 hypothetical protein Aru02nite_44190 [Actinocatenispora rupis]
MSTNTSAVGRWLAVLLVFLSRVPRTGLFLVSLAIVLAGLFLPGAVGGALLLVVAVLAGLICAATWPLLTWARRLPQLLALGLTVAIAVAKFF